MFRNRNVAAPSRKLKLRQAKDAGRLRRPRKLNDKRSRVRGACLSLMAFIIPMVFLEIFSPKEPTMGSRVEDMHSLVRVSPKTETSTIATKEKSTIRNEPSKPGSITSLHSKKTQTPKDKTIAFVVPMITNCGQQDAALMRDAGAVLRHSIHLQSSQTNNSGSHYGYEMYALTLNGKTCHNDVLEGLGYQILQADSPVKMDLIQSEHLRTELGKYPYEEGLGSFVQLAAHTLVKEPIFVLLSISTVVLKPLDHLFWAIQNPGGTPVGDKARTNIASGLERPGDALPQEIDHFFVRDYPNTAYGRKPVALTPGFLVARKNPALMKKTVTRLYKAHYKVGYDQSSGWGGKGYSLYFRGGLTMPGFYAYFLDEFLAASSVELDGCQYSHNGMDNLYRNPPRFDNRNEHISKCRSGEGFCGDCTATNVEEIYTILYDQTCNYPWSCDIRGRSDGQGGGTPIEHCTMLQHEWHKVRAEMERSIASQNLVVASGPKGKYKHDTFYGHCSGHDQYIGLTLPTQSELPGLMWG